MPRSDVLWATLIPTYRGTGRRLDPAALDCTGEVPVSATSTVNESTAELAGDAFVAPVADGLALAWLRGLGPQEPDGFASGPLALVGYRSTEIDVYAIGHYHGSAQHSRFEMGHMGATTIIMATDDGCAEAKNGARCVGTMWLYLASGGRLSVATTTPTQRVAYAVKKDMGRIQMHFTTEPPILGAASVQIKERLSVRDAADDEVRRSENERVFTLRGSELVTDGESLATSIDHL